MKVSLAGAKIAAALVLVAGASLEAQAPAKPFELGAFGRYAVYHSDMLNGNPSWGGGVQLGFFFVPTLAVEGDLALVSAHRYTSGEDMEDLLMRLRLTYALPLSESNRIFIGAGYTRETFDPQLSGKRTSNGFGGVIGWRHVLNEWSAFRVQGTWDRFAAKEAFASNEKGNILGIDFGLSWPGGGPRDIDRDGVLNVVDACPGTPLGEMVDARGCVLPKDADGDGVMDPNDACMGTPRSDRVDARGCSLPKDADNDGVVDSADQCANTPAGTPVTATGCPRDTDGDGVLDNADRCSDTPSGTRVDAAGCPLPDTDGDGVFDRDDRCANTPRGMAVDANGCQRLFDTTGGRTALVLEGVTFATGSATLTPTSLPVLDRVAESLVANSSVRVEVQGHTDNVGSAATNRRISQRRADAVRTYLMSKGVDAARLTAVGYGPDQPKVPNTTAANRAMNRRVELKQIP